jgi:hypothetical protein
MHGSFNNKQQDYINAINKSLIILYIICALFTFAVYKTHIYYYEYGYIKFRGISIIGQDALIPLYGMTLIDIVLIGFTAHQTNKSLINTKKNNIIYKPENYICCGCESVYKATQMPLFICPNCGKKLEDLSGFYLRHSNKRNSG